MTFPNDEQTKWLDAFPSETAFPDSLFFIPKWDLLDASNNIQRLRVKARMASNVNPQVIRVTTAAFCEAVGIKEKMLISTPLSEKWQIPRFRVKGAPIPWIQQIRAIKDDIANNRVSEKVFCVTLIDLERWTTMSAIDIRNALPTKPGPLKRFKAAKTLMIKFKDTLERFKQSQILEHEFRTHVLEPAWTSSEACACCKKLLNFSSEPRNITRRCPRPCDFPVQLLNTWASTYDQFILAIDGVISKLS